MVETPTSEKCLLNGSPLEIPALAVFQEKVNELPPEQVTNLLYHDLRNIAISKECSHLYTFMPGYRNSFPEIRRENMQEIIRAGREYARQKKKISRFTNPNQLIEARNRFEEVVLGDLDLELAEYADLAAALYKHRVELMAGVRGLGDNAVKEFAYKCRVCAAATRVLPVMIESAKFLVKPTSKCLDLLNIAKVSLKDIALLVDRSIECPDIEVSGTDAVILLNLLNNATKFNGGNSPEVVVNDAGVVQVTNYYEKPLLNRAFEMGVTEDTRRGHGFGLAIAKLYADITGKRIGIRNVKAKIQNHDGENIEGVKITTSLATGSMK